MCAHSIGTWGEVLSWSDNLVRRDKLEEIKGGSFGIWKNVPGNWLLGWSMASNLSDESSLVKSSGKGMIGNVGCRCMHSMRNACGHGGSDMLHECTCEAGRNRGPGSVDCIAWSNAVIASLCTFLWLLGLSTQPVVSEVSLAVGSSWRVRLSYRDEKAEMSIGENSAVRPRHKVYTRPIGQLLRGRTSEYEQGTLFITRKGALRCSMCYGLGAWVVVSTDTQ
jgi:hypothetical protein